MDKVVRLARNRGFVFPGSEIYGGLQNSWDYGPIGVELKRNIKELWWKMFVLERPDMVGIDANIIMNTRVWEASGHLDSFNDTLIECKKCHTRFRDDDLFVYMLSEKGKPRSTNTEELLKELVSFPCPECNNVGEFTKPKFFHTMFRTNLGSIETPENTVYLRPETAQAMFVDFAEIVRVSRKRLPFGIAQIGKAFRNEITTGNFIFRLREFEQMEIEYFIEPPKTKKDWEKHFDHWLKEIKKWLDVIGVDKNRVKEVEIPKKERAHYSERTVDIEFQYPFGQKELYGLAYRTDYDISAHQKHSGESLKYRDPKTGKEFVPHVIEPSLGVERTILAVLLSAYTEEEVVSAKGEKETRIVLKLPSIIAPYKVAILPLSDKAELTKMAESIRKELIGDFSVDYDTTQSIGKRYRRQDEIGTPYCVTVDFDSLDDKKVTIRDRDTMKQDRVEIKKIREYLNKKLI
ncbi:MAG: glycine--tRNA ligase [Candidatus Colwellbacteria bacterium CG10_big_fil_rev_8_21_14_0_10_42_22]|uniref:Glycine--tRNA ligase n=1 Tax=Candidatus Colwellbacteria bacterium CG10_big_fil_rev_8_21_14_0_10_42_22 TaxID=1974540 RepID=A0A2H0VIG0_9BACT|nr:MAG: glycine--tRNA ligase [Candidatus Colwellbacteria bacterium CG10_big_fil_rev_8_21_14_0_10_42_22]